MNIHLPFLRPGVNAAIRSSVPDVSGAASTYAISSVNLASSQKGAAAYKVQHHTMVHPLIWAVGTGGGAAVRHNLVLWVASVERPVRGSPPAQVHLRADRSATAPHRLHSFFRVCAHFADRSDAHLRSVGSRKRPPQYLTRRLASFKNLAR